MKILNTAQELIYIQDDIVSRTLTYGTEFDIYMFEQTWASTALGFGGCGGSAITTATTYVLCPQTEDCAYVYFGHRFAYKINHVNEIFKEDLRNRRMSDVMGSGKYGIKK